MATSSSVISATYSDLKTVKSRGVVQIVLEMPIEGMAEAFGLLGAPLPGNEVWVAIARLRSKPEALDALASVTTVEPPAKGATKLSTLAGILCNEGGFHAYLRENGFSVASVDDAATALRLACGGIKSRRELDANEQAGAKFRDLRANYQAWLKDPVDA